MARCRRSLKRLSALALVAGLGAPLVLAGGCSDSSGYVYGRTDLGDSGASGGGGGSNEPVPCVSQEDCPAGTLCEEFTCQNGVCVLTFGYPGKVVEDESPSDCRKTVCGMEGEVLFAEPSDTETPEDDGNECTENICSNGGAAYTSKPDGTACSLGGCIDGECLPIPCGAAADCPDAPTCSKSVCVNNMCGLEPQPAGTLVMDDSSLDCKMIACDGMGGVLSGAPDPDDMPTDGNACTKDACDGAAPVHTQEPDGQACAAGMYCYQGACSQCGVDANCAPGACEEPGTCAAGQCVAGAAKPDGTACAAGMYCYQGACSQCGVTANCPAPATCKVLQQCNGTCVYGNAPNGTSCGFLKTCTNGVCS